MNTRHLRLSTAALALGLLFTAPLMADDYNLMLNLTCRGSGVATKSESANINTYDPKTKKYRTTTAQSSSKEPFQGIAVVEIAGGMGRIKLPEPMVPPLSTRDEGWFKINDMVVTPDVITGKIKVNFLNNKALRIDRRSGLLTIDGSSGSFSGQCEATDLNAPRKF
ncbi:MAG: hypothetical protein HGB29_01385 [Chlorobiaceae bacterium]|nr:hypothetical protein [Chlorobiaceae bacterium]NTW73500.1 hypothetical protein [Chlorobiaceae bacterium]